MAALALTQPAINSSLHAVSVGSDKYKGAVVEDLQLPPAFSLPLFEPISQAIELASERDFSHIPVLDRHRRPVGYVDVAKLKEKWEANEADPTDKVSQYMTKFMRTASHPYTIITPLTPLSDLEQFLQTHLFALVTDTNRKFVLAVATQQDLSNFVTRRGI
ncbi:hypothetical protein C0993_012679 [Termitomyces sp. T159_Od127]|nr:hypothetical protein C0993_012679 [Termitomyces sp. T159_Od127]